VKISAFVLGIIGGLIALSYGVIGYGLGSIPAPSQHAATSAFIRALSLIIPIMSLTGAGMVLSKPRVGAYLMGGAAWLLILSLGFNFFSLTPVILLGIAAFFGFMDAQEEQSEQQPSPFKRKPRKKILLFKRTLKQKLPLGEDFFKD
jgi:uncharacterized membrane protein